MLVAIEGGHRHQRVDAPGHASIPIADRDWGDAFIIMTSCWGSERVSGRAEASSTHPPIIQETVCGNRVVSLKECHPERRKDLFWCAPVMLPWQTKSATGSPSLRSRGRRYVLGRDCNVSARQGKPASFGFRWKAELGECSSIPTALHCVRAACSQCRILCASAGDNHLAITGFRLPLVGTTNRGQTR